MNEQTVLHPHEGTLHSNRERTICWYTTTWPNGNHIVLSERRPTQKVSHFSVRWCDILPRQDYRDIKSISVCQELGLGGHLRGCGIILPPECDYTTIYFLWKVSEVDTKRSEFYFSFKMGKHTSLGKRGVGLEDLARDISSFSLSLPSMRGAPAVPQGHDFSQLCP